MRSLPPLLAICILLAAAAPAHAVIGGERIAPTAVPAFASYGCGATLVAPDRVVTAIHCIAAYPFSSIEHISVGGVANTVTNISMHPSWRERNGSDNVVNDIAIMQLRTPVTDITPATIGDAADHVGEPATIVGNGRSAAPGTKAPGEGFGGGLRAAELKVLSDRQCRAAFGDARGNGGEVFVPSASVCAIDADGRAPLNSGCNGDSGGPLLTGPLDAPVLLGIVSYGGRLCGADHLPSVFTDAGRFRDFITNPHPVWAPRSTTPAKIVADPPARRPGGRLTCKVADVPRGARAEFAWKRFSSHGSPKIVSRKASYTIRRGDRGARLVCFARVSNRGGFLAVPDGPGMIVKIPR